MRTSNRELWTESLFQGAHTAAPARRHNRHPEQAVLNTIIKVLRIKPASDKVAWVVRMNSGAYKMPDGRFIRFGFPGCPDIIGQMRDGRFLAIEVKAGKGRATEAQLAAIYEISRHGGCAGVAWSIEDALAIVGCRRA